MRAPEKRGRGFGTRWTPPDYEWLYDQYITQEKSANKIAIQEGTYASNVIDWLWAAKITPRTHLQARGLPGAQHDQTGSKGPGWKDGRSGTYNRKLVRQILKKARAAEMCTKCGTTRGRLVVHHKDGNPYNNILENLEWVCHPCHMSVHAEMRHKGITVTSIKG